MMIATWRGIGPKASDFHDLRFLAFTAASTLEMIVVRLLHFLLGMLLVVEETCSVF